MGKGAPGKGNESLSVEGRVEFVDLDRELEDVGLRADVFDSEGRLIGSAPVDASGAFRVGLPLKDPAPVTISLSPAAESVSRRSAQTFRAGFDRASWKGGVLDATLKVPKHTWPLWWPRLVCVAGRVRNQRPDGSECPVAFVKVEIFDVDRESCWWPPIVKWWKERPKFPRIPERVIRAADLIRPPVPPDPVGPIAFFDPGSFEMLNPQPIPPREALLAEPMPSPIDWATLNPQPLPPKVSRAELSFSAEAATLDKALEAITITSLTPPWDLWPHCFYSRRLVCETFTDCNGRFECCFNWWPFHVRNGRFRFDPRPDIIIRVTQVIDGVARVIYMDPYSSTRWDSTGAYIDLHLNDPRVVCGTGCSDGPLLGNSQAAILQVGSDPVWHINQANGKFEVPPFSNGGFGQGLYIRGDFSADLKAGGPRYYRLRYRRDTTAAFTDLSTPLSALRALPLGSFATHNLGPQTVGPTHNLYEIQDSAHWWLMPGTPGGPGTVIGYLPTESIEPDEGLYVLQMELFNAAGALMAAIQFPNHGGDGTGVDPSPPPVTVGSTELRIFVDNKPVTFNLTVTGANACGIIPWSPALPATNIFHVHAEQENGRVHSWTLTWHKGLTLVSGTVGDATFVAGASPVDADLAPGSMLADATPSGFIESSCAYALSLTAYAHIRNNWGWWYQGQKLYGVAIERCVCPPAPPMPG